MTRDEYYAEFWETLFALFGAASINKPSHKAHNGRGNGDCANCPPITDTDTADGITVIATSEVAIKAKGILNLIILNLQRSISAEKFSLLKKSKFVL